MFHRENNKKKYLIRELFFDKLVYFYVLDITCYLEIWVCVVVYVCVFVFMCRYVESACEGVLI